METTEEQRSHIPGSQEARHPEPYRWPARLGFVIGAVVAVLWPLSLYFARRTLGGWWLSAAELWWVFLAAYLIAFTIVRIGRRTRHP